jgi:Flp pilus assembly protein TadG
MRGRSSRGRWDEGATAVETAITIPLSLALIFGIIEFGMALWQSNTMVLAVEEAGRQLMVNNASGNSSCNNPTCAQNLMTAVLSNYGGNVSGVCSGSPPNAGTICVSASGPQGANPQTMTLTAVYAYSNIIVPTGLLAGILSGPFTSTSQATFPLD